MKCFVSRPVIDNNYAFSINFFNALAFFIQQKIILRMDFDVFNFNFIEFCGVIIFCFYFIYFLKNSISFKLNKSFLYN